MRSPRSDRPPLRWLAVGALAFAATVAGCSSDGPREGSADVPATATAAPPSTSDTSTSADESAGTTTQPSSSPGTAATVDATGTTEGELGPDDTTLGGSVADFDALLIPSPGSPLTFRLRNVGRLADSYALELVDGGQLQLAPTTADLEPDAEVVVTITGGTAPAGARIVVRSDGRGDEIASADLS